jgi:hypothetical protein
VQGEDGFVYQTNIELPQNTAGVPWAGNLSREGNPALPVLELFRVEKFVKEKAEDVAFTIRIVDGPLALISPKQGFASGSRYRFTYFRKGSGRIQRGPQVIEVRIGSQKMTVRSVMPPLHVGEPSFRQIAVAAGRSCSRMIQAVTRDIELKLPEDLSIWKDALLYSLRVDGVPWRPTDNLCKSVPPGRSWMATGTDMLYGTCGSSSSIVREDGISPGTHQIEMTAWLPGTSVKYVSAANVAMSCTK